MSLKLSTPAQFPAFPFIPYNIQLDLMRHLYTSIEDKKVTIVESPTGTGKTLSLLCASLTWLNDEQDRARNGILNELSGTGDGPDWVLAQTLDRRRRELEAEDQEYAERLAKARKKEAALRKRSNARVRKRQKTIVEDEVDDDESSFLPEDDDAQEDSDNETSNLSPEVRALMNRLRHSGSSLPDDPEQEPVCTKIYYASRTHSQLAQVLHELHKLRITLDVSVPSLGDPSDSSESPAIHGKRPLSKMDQCSDENGRCGSTRTVSLGSRKQLCINEELRRRTTDLDESCRQMLSEKGKKRCPYLPLPEDESRMLDLRDQILASPKDIEDVVVTGQNIETCPYFGSRRAVRQAQLVLLPYNLLLQRTAREALGIDLRDHVVIIDEAHNLISTLLSLSTTRLPLRTLSTAHQQVSIYLSRFRTRLKTTHALHLTRLVTLLDSLQRYAEQWRQRQDQGCAVDQQTDKGRTFGSGNANARGGSTNVEVTTPGELLRRLGRKTEGVNLLEVETYLRSSKIARKISGYSVKAMEKAAGQDPVKLAKIARLSSTTPPLHVVESFIAALTTANDDGRVTLSIVDNQVEIKYQHLNPSTCFQDVIDTARSVILAGGTMSPISDVVSQLFADLPKDRLATFSCGHIIPSSNLQTLVLKKGPRGGDLQFKFGQRNNQAMIGELGQILLNFVHMVPGGMVVFLPSYSFLSVVRTAWESTGVMAKLSNKKKIFSEPQDSAQVEAVLRDYTLTIQGTGSTMGALLFAVIGAKLSEGLNFSDDLARAVIIIGLPFANLASPELRERMDYVNRLEQRRHAESVDTTRVTAANGRKDAATELYENMCMNAVNQSIGRAIRHRGDWASLILIDDRYASLRVRNKLPRWIEQTTIIAEGFGQAVREMGRFYREKRGPR